MADDLEVGSADYNPLRFNKTLFQKMDDLLPEMEAFLVELRNFKKGLGNGEWSTPWWPKPPMPIGGPGHD